MSEANSCDACARERATLYEVNGRLICLMCLPFEWLTGAGAARAIRRSVTGRMNIERRRRRLAHADGGSGCQRGTLVQVKGAAPHAEARRRAAA